MRRSHADLDDTVTEMTSSREGIDRRLRNNEKQARDLGDGLVGISQSAQQREIKESNKQHG